MSIVFSGWLRENTSYRWMTSIVAIIGPQAVPQLLGLQPANRYNRPMIITAARLGSSG